MNTELTLNEKFEKATKLLKLIFANKKFNLNYNEFSDVVVVRKLNTDKVFGYVEIEKGKTTFLPV